MQESADQTPQRDNVLAFPAAMLQPQAGPNGDPGNLPGVQRQTDRRSGMKSRQDELARYHLFKVVYSELEAILPHLDCHLRMTHGGAAMLNPADTQARESRFQVDIYYGRQEGTIGPVVIVINDREVGRERDEVSRHAFIALCALIKVWRENETLREIRAKAAVKFLGDHFL